jgi:hypothetical protein
VRVAALLLLAACGRFGFTGSGDDGNGSGDGGRGADGDGVSTDDGSTSSDLIVWYRMEDNVTDGTLDDSAGIDQAAHCTVGVSCGINVAGKIGQGVALNGSSQFYTLVSDPTLVTPTQFTVAFWVKLDAYTNLEHAFTKRYSAVNNSWGVYFTTVGDMVYETTREPGPTGDFDSIGGVPPLGVWTHFAVTWDDTTKRGYVNGVLMLLVGAPDVTFDAGELLLGADDDGTPYGFLSGSLDEVRLYNRALGDAEIQMLAQ